MKYLIGLLVLAVLIEVLISCSSDAPPFPDAQVVTCAKAPKAPAVPGLPRTTETLAAYANALKAAYEGAVSARNDCAAKLELGPPR